MSFESEQREAVEWLCANDVRIYFFNDGYKDIVMFSTRTWTFRTPVIGDLGYMTAMACANFESYDRSLVNG